MKIESENVPVDEAHNYEAVIHKFWRDEESGKRKHELIDDFDPYYYLPVEEIERIKEEVGWDDDEEVNNRVLVEHYLRKQDVDADWVDADDLARNIKSTEPVEDKEGLYGEDLIKVSTYHTKNFRQIREQFEYHFEADVAFTNRYILDEIEDEDYTDNMRIQHMDIEVSDKGGFADIESADKPIIAIATHDNFTDQYKVFTWREEQEEQLKKTELEDGTKVRCFNTEEMMLKSYLKHLEDTDPSILTGWNFVSYDAAYLYNRLDKNTDISPSGLAAEKIDNGQTYLRRNDGENYLRVKGREMFDLLKAYRTFKYGQKDSYKLDDIAKDEIGKEKIVMEQGFHEMWKNDFKKFIEYNKRDVELTVELDEELGLIDFWAELRQITNNSLEEVLISMRQVDHYILDYAHEEMDMILPSKGQIDKEDDTAIGGEVFEPKKEGVVENVSVCDLSSLYPSVMITFNISPETLDSKGDIEIMTVNEGTEDEREIRYTTEQRGLLPQVFGELFDKRYEYKNKRAEAEDGSQEEKVYDDRQRGVKVTMNCWTPDTELVTPQGLLTVDELEEGDKVYSIDPNSREVELKEIENKYEKEYHGDMVHFQSNHTDLNVTPNHRMLVQNFNSSNSYDDPEFVQAADLNTGSTVQMPSGKRMDGNKPEKFRPHEWMNEGEILVSDISSPEDCDGNWQGDGRNFRKFIEEKTDAEIVRRQGNGTYILPIDTDSGVLEVIDRKWGNIQVRNGNKQVKPVPWSYDIRNWLELLGWYVAEGCIVKFKNKDSYMLNITQDEGEPVKELLSDMGLDYSISDRDIQTRARVLTDWISEYIGRNSDEKGLPEWLFELDADLLEIFFDAAMNGDGSSDGRNHYYTTSKELKEDFVKLAVHLGKKPKVYTQTAPKTPNLPNGKPDRGYKDSYKDLFTVQFTDNKGCISQRNIHIESNDYDRVVCVGVKDNETVLAGRNGKFQWTGNTIYGTLLNPYFRLYDPDLGRSVTKMGRETVKWSGEIAEEEGYEVIYGDTDSIFVETGGEDIKAINDTIEKIDDSYDEFVKNHGVDLDKWDHRLILEFEKFCKRMFFTDTKKRYASSRKYVDSKDSVWMKRDDGTTALVSPDTEIAGVKASEIEPGFQIGDSNIVNVEELPIGELDDPYVSITGFECVRSDTSTYAREVQRTVLEKIVQGEDKEDILSYIKEKRQAVVNGEVDMEDIGIPSGIGKKLNNYKSKTPHVRGCIYANRYYGTNYGEGDKVKLIWLQGSRNNVSSDDNQQTLGSVSKRKKINQIDCIAFQEEHEIDWEELHVDWRKMAQKTIDQRLKRILDSLGMSLEEARGSQKLGDAV